MPRFILLLNDQAKYAAMSPEEMNDAMHAFMAWNQEMRQSGKVVGGERLEIGGRIIGPKPGLTVTEAPFAETRETVGGFFVIEAASLDEASAIAMSNPNLTYGGSVEVRPIWEMEG